MEKLWNQNGSFNLPMWSWLELRSASEGSESRANRSGAFHVTGGAACFLTAQSHHRYFTDSRNPFGSHRRNHYTDNGYMYTVTTCRCQS